MPWDFLATTLTTLGHFIFTGILERFPKLRLAILESNAGWLPFWLGRMDDHTHGRNSVMGKSDCGCVRATASCAPVHDLLRQRRARALKYVVDDLKGENIVWNTAITADAIDPKQALTSTRNRFLTTPNARYFGTMP